VIPIAPIEGSNSRTLFVEKSLLRNPSRSNVCISAALYVGEKRQRDGETECMCVCVFVRFQRFLCLFLMVNLLSGHSARLL